MSATASSKPFGLFQDSGDSSKVPREATSQYTLRPRRRPRVTQKSFPPASRGEGMQKAVVAETTPTSSADSSASVAHSAGTSGEFGPHMKKRNDFEEQAELVDVLNMLSQMYRDQANSYHQHTEIVKDLGGLRAIEDQCRLYAMDDDNPLQTSVRKALLRLQMEMALSEQASRSQTIQSARQFARC